MGVVAVAGAELAVAWGAGAVAVAVAVGVVAGVVTKQAAAQGNVVAFCWRMKI